MKRLRQYFLATSPPVNLQNGEEDYQLSHMNGEHSTGTVVLWKRNLLVDVRPRGHGIHKQVTLVMKVL